MSTLLAEATLISLETTLPHDEDLICISAVKNFPRAPALKELTLHYSETRTDTLIKLLALTSNLEVFRYEVCHDLEGYEAYDCCGHLSLQNLWQALRQVQRTLKILEIRAAWYAPSGINEGHLLAKRFFGFNDRLGSLNDFNCLTHVELPIVFTEGQGSDGRTLSSFLPPTLEQLCLRDDGWQWECMDWFRPCGDYEERLASDFRGCKVWVPHLEEVVFKNNCDMGAVELEAADSYEKVIASEGIAVRTLWREEKCDPSGYI